MQGTNGPKMNNSSQKFAAHGGKQMKDSEFSEQMLRKMWFVFGCLYASKSMRDEWLTKLGKEFVLADEFKAFMDGEQARFLHRIGYRPVEGKKVGDGIAEQVVDALSKHKRIRELKSEIMKVKGGV